MNRIEDLQSEDNKRVACFLIQLRLDHGLSIKELSQRTGVSVYKLKKIEEGKRLIQFHEVDLLAEAYCLNPARLHLNLSNLYIELKKEILKRKKAIFFAEANHP